MRNVVCNDIGYCSVLIMHIMRSRHGNPALYARLSRRRCCQAKLPRPVSHPATCCPGSAWCARRRQAAEGFAECPSTSPTRATSSRTEEDSPASRATHPEWQGARSGESLRTPSVCIVDTPRCKKSWSRGLGIPRDHHHAHSHTRPHVLASWNRLFMHPHAYAQP